MTETIVDEIRNVVLLFSNPVWSGSNSIPSTIIRNITALSSQIAYSAHIDKNITVLSSRYAQTDNGIIQGLLYVPDISAVNPCASRKGAYVPSTAVTRDDLPPTNYNLVAIAPWIDAECSKAFLSSAGTDPLRAFIFYHPDNSSDAPPSAGDDAWDMQDGGSWRKTNRFPIYAVSGLIGQEMMGQLSQYSGSLAEVPYGDNITALYNPDPEDYVRIWTEVRVSTPTGLPTMWIFILVVIGVLLFVVTASSLLMHCIQRRRRLSLERRVRSGEVNLEAMGIKRMTVPLEHVEKFPLFTYNYEPEAFSVPTSPMSPRQPGKSETRRSSHTPSEPITGITSENDSPSPATKSAITAITTATEDQPTCHICLENYQKRVTIIREIPCGHIFHPDCIDEFLSRVSSLCPICKASVLPSGYCPKITNAMVKRERALRKLRDHIVIDDSDSESTHDRIQSWGSNIKRKLSLASRGRPPPTVVEERELQVREHRKSPTELIRQRMRDLAGADPDDEDSQEGRPRWRRLMHKVFPGFS
ncbi:Ring finger domain protein [Pleurostoma richardsiae]|uniref:Ring finger domain protein n=1 Tax=Pleurostoma richardsiae TaxID=41990 RepID=A0AA38S138_9PEZI|nr:Ring finger domain protein [Pleurostoma richardsiae]